MPQMLIFMTNGFVTDRVKDVCPDQIYIGYKLI
jgi:hypothetical protein